MFLNILYIFIGLTTLFLIFIVICTFLGRCKTKKEIEYDEKLKKSLKDEFIIDPETGKKLTLKEAETGIWNIDKKNSQKSEIENIPFEKDKQIEIILQYFKENENYKNEELNFEQIVLLKKSNTLGKYKNCSFNYSFSFENGFAIIVVPIIRNPIHFAPSSGRFLDEQLLFWFDIGKEGCDFYYNGSNISVNIENCRNKEQIENLVSEIQKLDKVTIEIYSGKLYIKTSKLATLDDVINFEKIKNTFANNQ
jgi:hypothetical protein